MSLGRNTLMCAFAVVGFLLGSVLYLLANWIIVNGWSIILYIPIPVITPWLASGFSGALLSILILYIVSRYSGNE